MVKGNVVALLIMIFIGAIVSLTFLDSISNNIAGQTTLLAITNESQDISGARISNEQINESFTFTVTNNPGASGRKNVSINGFVIRNDTGAVATITTDYVINVSNGVYNLVNSSFWVFNGTSNQTNGTVRDYNFPSAEYVTDIGSRSIISLILIFAAIAIFIFVIVMLFKGDNVISNTLRGK